MINEPLHIVDWFPTLVNLTGGSLQQKHPLDGLDIWPVIIAGKPSPHKDILINAMPNSGAINQRLEAGAQRRSGSRTTPKQRKRNPEGEVLELFNRRKTRAKGSNLADSNKEIVERLRSRLEAYRKAAVPAKGGDEPAGLKPPQVWGER